MFFRPHGVLFSYFPLMPQLQKDGDGGDDDDTLPHEGRAAFSRTRKKFNSSTKHPRNAMDMEEMNRADALEFRMLAKDVFLKWVMQ